MRLDHCGLSAKTTLYHIWIDGSLCKKINSTDLLSLFFKDTDKFLTNDLTLRFRLSNSRKFIIISLLCIHTDKIQVKLSIRTKYTLNLIALVFTKKAMIYKHTCQLLANSSGKKSCCYRRINTARQCQKDFAVAHFLTDFFNCMLNKCIHLPVSGTFAYTKYEIG